MSDIGGWILEFNDAQIVNDLFTFSVYLILLSSLLFFLFFFVQLELR